MKVTMTWGAEKAVSTCQIKGSLKPDRNTQLLVSREMPLSKHSVLVVDDDLNMTRLMATILRTSGIEPLTANNGYAALDAVAHNAIDAIVLDVQMPGMDGRSFFRELRARGNKTPVLIASADGAREVQRELGAEASVEKPFDPEVLINELERILQA